MAANTFVSGAFTVTLPGAPAKGRGYQHERVQPRAYSRTGVLYLYDREVQIKTHLPTWRNVPAATLANINSLFDIYALGEAVQFYWYDQNNSAHLVTLIGKISAVEGPVGEYRVSMTLEEQI